MRGSEIRVNQIRVNQGLGVVQKFETNKLCGCLFGQPIETIHDIL